MSRINSGQPAVYSSRERQGTIGNQQNPSSNHVVSGRGGGSVGGIVHKRQYFTDIDVDENGLSSDVEIEIELDESFRRDVGTRGIRQLSFLCLLSGSLPDDWDASTLKEQFTFNADIEVLQGRQTEHVAAAVSMRITEHVQGGVDLAIFPNVADYSATRFVLKVPSSALPAANTSETYTVSAGLLMTWG